MRSTSSIAPAGSLLVVLVAVFLLLGLGPVAAAVDTDRSPHQSVQDELSKFRALAPIELSDLDSPADLAPDISLLVDRSGSPPVADAPENSDTTDDGEWWIAVREELVDRPEVSSVAVDFPGADATAFHIGLDRAAMGQQSVAEATTALRDLVETETDAANRAVSVVAGGRALSDASILDRYGTSVRWLALLAVVMAAYIGWRLGPRRGLAMAIAWGGSVLLAGRIAAQVVGPFDGTVATGPLVGAVAGMVFALAVGLRVLKWYEDPVSTDSADAITLSLVEVVSDVILVLGSLVSVVGLLWIAGGSSRPVVAVIVGGLVGAAFTAAIVAPTMAALASDAHPLGGLLPVTVPSGSRLMIATVLGLVGLLAVLSVFSLRSPGNDLIDYRSLPGDDSTRVVGDLLGGGPGDPTEALVTAVREPGGDATETWAQAVATIGNVAWVDTATARFTGAGASAVDPRLSLASREQIGFGSSELAVIVPAVPVRSADGARLADEIVRLADERVDVHGAAGPIGRGSTVLIVSIIVLMALAGAGTVLVETNNAGFTLTSFVLRLLGGGATVGLFRLVSVDASTGDVIAALTLVAAVAGLFELEYLHDRVRFGDRWSVSSGMAAVDQNGSAEAVAVNGTSGITGTNGSNSTVETPTVEPSTAEEPAADGAAEPVRAGLLAGLGMLVAACWLSVTRFVGGGPMVGRFGFALALALLIEIVVGFLVLRPALLGEHAAYHSVARPLRSTIHTGQRRRRSQPVSTDDPAWRRLVADLLMAEFGLQTDPATTRVEDVFLEDTPLFGQVAKQHRSLSASGLRVSGRAPQIRQVETYREGPSIMVAVTVDHPERHLADSDGTVYGVRRAERRSSMLWIVRLDDGAVRIAESIDMGSVPLDVDKPPDKTTFPEVATVSG